MNFRQLSAFIFLSIAWGTSFLWIKIALQEMSPVLLVTIRLAVGVIALIPFFIKEKSGFPKTGKKWLVLFIQGLISTAIPWMLITWAELHISSAEAVIVNSTVPIFTLLIAQFFLPEEKINLNKVIGIVLATIGITLMVFQNLIGVNMDSLRVMGLLAMLGSAICYGAGNVFARVNLKGTPLVFQTIFTMLLADIFMWAILPVIESPIILPVKGITWFAIVWLGALGSSVCYLLFYYLLHEIGPFRTSFIAYTIPVIGVSLGVIFLNESLSYYMLAGAAFIFAGVWKVSRKKVEVVTEKA